MIEPEEKNQALDEQPSSEMKSSLPSLEDLEFVSATKPEEGTSSVNIPELKASLEKHSEAPSPQKIELKKHALHTAAANTVKSSPGGSQAPQEVPANVLPVDIKIEIDFLLDRQQIPLSTLRTLAEGEMITLSGTNFKATLFLQNKAIGEGELIMVDEKPTVQITQVFSGL